MLLLKKKLLILVPILVVAAVFSFVPDTAQAQSSPDDTLNLSNDIENASRNATTDEERAAAREAAVANNPHGNEIGVPEVNSKVGLTGWRLEIYNLITTLGAFFAWLGGWLLDVSISVFVINMANTANVMGISLAIEGLWSVIRDLFNLLFIFGLIYIGFKTILNADESGSKKLLGNLIVAALLINFSLYIAQVVVDFSNVAAYQIGGLINAGSYGENIFGSEVIDISSSFINATDLTKLPPNSQESLNNLLGPDSGFSGAVAALVLGFVVMIMLIVIGFVFAAGAIILFTRFIALTLLMIFSPALFLGMVIPIGGYGSKWWKYLFNQALIGPVFIFMLYLSLRALQGLPQVESPTITGLFIYFLIVIGFVYASLMVARSLSSWGALQSYNFGEAAIGRLRGATGSMTAGTFAAGLRNTVGSGSDKFANSKFAGRLARRGGLLGTIGRSAISAADRTRQASFDVRRVGGLGKSLGIGEGQKGGFVERQKKIDKREKRIAGLIKTSDDRYYEDAGVSDIHEMYKQQQTRRDELYANLSNSSDPEERTNITADINRTNRVIANLEEPEKRKRPANIDEHQWERIKIFSQTKGNIEKVVQNEYAANLEARGDKLPPGLQHAYRWLIRSKAENKKAASHIRKEANKSKEDKNAEKIVDAVKSNNKAA